MQLTSQSEWMKAQKHADVMKPDGRFDVIQTSNETSVFFSLGTDNILWATREAQMSSVGWTRKDLSSGLSTSFQGASVKAKAFAVSQNPVSGRWDLVLVASANNSDHLFISQGNDYDAQVDQSSAIKWTEVKYDADGADVKPVQIADVFVINVPNAGSTCIVDIWREPGTNNSLDRYFITPGARTQWNKHLLAIDLDAGSVTSTLGQRPKPQVPVIYTFGSIEGQQRLIFAPLTEPFRGGAPRPTRLTLPSGVTSIASAIDKAGHSSLYISEASGLSVYPTTGQSEGATAIPCIKSPLVASASELQAMTVGSTTSIWGLNSQGNLFYATCPVGNETQASAWSAPVILLQHAEGFAFYNGMHTSSHTLFAHVNGQLLVELDQDPMTTIWRQRKIMLPSTDDDDLQEFDSYTTRLTVLDDQKIPQANVQVKVTSVSPVPVFIDDAYFTLSPQVPVTVTTDVRGSISIMQQTDSMASVCYNVSIAGSTPTLVDPALSVMQRLQVISTGDDLAAIRITDSAGTVKPLINDSVGNDDRAAAAQAIKQLTTIAHDLNADGSPIKPQPTNTVNLVQRIPAVAHAMLDRVSDLTHIGTHGLLHAAVTPKLRLNLEAPSFLIKAGDFFQMLGHDLEQGLRSLEIHIVNGVHNVVAKIGNVVYQALLDCKSAVLSAAKWIFDRLKILWDDLIAWLGFMFGWKDIMRTHMVMKNLVKQYVWQAIHAVQTAEERVSTVFEGLEQKLNLLTGVTDPGITVGSVTAATHDNDGSSSPQSHWGLNHMQSNLPNARITSQQDDDHSVLGSLKLILDDLEALALNEVAFMKTMADQVRKQVVEPFRDLTPLELTKRLIGIISDLLLKSAKNLIVKFLDIIKALAQTVFNMLDAPIDIPVLGPFYQKITGVKLSALDLIVFVLAIPATVMYKIAVRAAPFADDALTAALTNAADFQTIKDIVKAGKPVTASGPNHPPNAVMHVRIAAAIPPDDYTAVYRVFSIIGQYFGAFAAWLGQIVTNEKLKDHTGGALPKPWQLADAISTVIGLVPTIIANFDHTGTWEVIMSNVVADLGILKTLVGKSKILSDIKVWNETIDPVLSIVLQAISLPPAIGNVIEAGKTMKPNLPVGLAAKGLGSCAGICNAGAWMIDADEEPIEEVIEAVLIVSANVCSLTQGLLMISRASMLSAGT